MKDPCEIGKAGGTVWCDGCSTGYIAGVKTTDKAKVEAALAAAGGAKPAADIVPVTFGASGGNPLNTTLYQRFLDAPNVTRLGLFFWSAQFNPVKPPPNSIDPPANVGYIIYRNSTLKHHEDDGSRSLLLAVDRALFAARARR